MLAATGDDGKAAESSGWSQRSCLKSSSDLRWRSASAQNWTAKKNGNNICKHGFFFFEVVESLFLWDLHFEKNPWKGQYLHSPTSQFSNVWVGFGNSAADNPREVWSPQKFTQLLATCGALSSLMCLHKSCRFSTRLGNETFPELLFAGEGDSVRTHGYFCNPILYTYIYIAMLYICIYIYTYINININIYVCSIHFKSQPFWSNTMPQVRLLCARP